MSLLGTNPYFEKQGNTPRPTGPQAPGSLFPSNYSERPDVLTPPDLERYDEYNLIAKNCNAVSKSIQSLRDYAFKDGMEWIPNFSLRCMRCNYEHPRLSSPLLCGRCRAPAADLVAPADEERLIAEAFFKRVDYEGHTMTDVLKMLEWDLNVYDNAYLVIEKDYELAPADIPASSTPVPVVLPSGRKVTIPANTPVRKGDILDWRVTGLTIGDPRTMRIVANQRTNRKGGKWRICLAHRPGTGDPADPVSAVQGNSAAVYGQTGLQTPDTRICPVDGCGMVLHDVWYTATKPATRDVAERYYIADTRAVDGTILQEVIHVSKYNPSYLYGTSPLRSIYWMVTALMDMERYIGTFYREERVPRMAGFVPTPNFKSFLPVWNSAQDRNVSSDGHDFPLFAYDPGIAGGPRPIQIVELSKLPADLQYLQVRDEFYRRIGSAFDVSPVFQGSVDAVGVRQSGPAQWMVTTLGAQKAQNIHNDRLIPSVLSQLKCKNWTCALREVEEDDEMKRWQVKQLEANYAATMQSLGAPWMYRDPQGHFVFPDRPTAAIPGPMAAPPPSPPTTSPPPGEPAQ